MKKINKKGLSRSDQRGFTLIELLIVIGIVGILAGIVLVAVNPAVQFGKANDTERKSEISSVLNAVYQFQASPSSRGALPMCMFGAVPAATAIPECDTDSSGAGVGNGGFEGAVELGTPADAGTYDCTNVLTPFYIKDIPVDPDNNDFDSTGTGYFICQHTVGGQVQVYVLSAGTEVFKDDGGCDMMLGSPAALSQVMCVKG